MDVLYYEQLTDEYLSIAARANNKNPKRMHQNHWKILPNDGPSSPRQSLCNIGIKKLEGLYINKVPVYNMNVNTHTNDHTNSNTNEYSEQTQQKSHQR